MWSPVVCPAKCGLWPAAGLSPAGDAGSCKYAVFCVAHSATVPTSPPWCGSHGGGGVKPREAGDASRHSAARMPGWRKLGYYNYVYCEAEGAI